MNRHSLLTLPLLFCGLTAALPAQQASPAPSPVFGRVVDATGQAVAGAAVEARRDRLAGVPPVLAPLFQESGRIAGRATTDERGRFVLSLDRADSVALHATHPDAARRLRSPTVYPVQPGSIVELAVVPVEARAGKIALVGPDDDLDGCRVGVWFERDPQSAGAFAPNPYRPTSWFCEPSHWGELAADGSFEVEAPAGAAWKLGCPDLPLVWPVAGDAEAGELAVGGRAHLKRGRVVGPNGKPVAGALIRSERAPRGSGVRSDADGGFALMVAGDPYLLCDAPGFSPDAFLASQETFQLQVGAKTRVRVQSEAGEPLSAARLVLVHWTNGPVTSSPVPVDGITGEDGGIDCYGGYPVTAYLVTDDRVVRLFDLPGGKRAEDVVVETEFRTLRGTVLDGTGAPAAHVPVYLTPRAAPKREQFANAWAPVAFTDHGGRFTIPGILDGDYWIGARSLSAGPTVLDFEVSDENLAPELRLPQVPMIRGRVVAPDGSGHAGVLVGVLCGMRAEERLSRLGIASAYVRTAADGSFEVPAITGEEEHRLTVRWPGDYEDRHGEKVQPGAGPLTIELVR